MNVSRLLHVCGKQRSSGKAARILGCREQDERRGVGEGVRRRAGQKRVRYREMHGWLLCAKDHAILIVLRESWMKVT